MSHAHGGRPGAQRHPRVRGLPEHRVHRQPGGRDHEQLRVQRRPVPICAGDLDAQERPVRRSHVYEDRSDQGARGIEDQESRRLQGVHAAGRAVRRRRPDRSVPRLARAEGRLGEPGAVAVAGRQRPARAREDRRGRAAGVAPALRVSMREHDEREHVVGYRRPPGDLCVLRRRNGCTRRRRWRATRAAVRRSP